MIDRTRTLSRHCLAAALAAVVIAAAMPSLAQSISEAELMQRLDGKVVAPAPTLPPAFGKTRSFSAKERSPSPAETVPPVPIAQRPQVDLEIYFKPASSGVTKEALPDLELLGRVLSNERFKGTRFQIAGHTDGIGGAKYNLGLSKRRAEAVRRYLIARYKIEASRLEAVGHGKEQLKVPDEPASARNRRVQIVNLSAVK